MIHYDAVISGCGPTGAVLANLLAAQGLSVCVIERYAEVYDKPRAIVLDWEVMRALQYCGVAHTLFPTTRPHPGTDFLGLDGDLIKLFDPAPPPHALGWPATSTFIQPELERMLRRALELRPNVAMLLDHRVTGFNDAGDHVEVQYAGNSEGGNVQTVTADFLIGCDGANSATREALGASWVDLDFDQWWVVVDAWQRCDTDLPKKTTQYCWPSRPATLVHGPGNLRRWELKLLDGEKPGDFDDLPTLKAAMAPYVDIRCFDIWRHAAYRFAARTSDAWRRNRVFLAGDAVHQTPPFLGQGLCAGVRDAFNLAWKLVHVKRHGWNEAVLASYEQERRPHVAKIVEHAKEFGLIIGEMDETRARGRDRELRAQLESGQMVTTRQSFIPDLAGGLVTDLPMAGSLMVQPRVEANGQVADLMDDVLPMEFLLVTAGVEPQSWLQGFERAWSELRGVRVAFVPAPTESEGDVHIFVETDGTFASWAAGNDIRAAIIRPDRYVHGIARTRDELRRMLGDLCPTLMPPDQAGSRIANS